MFQIMSDIGPLTDISQAWRKWTKHLLQIKPPIQLREFCVANTLPLAQRSNKTKLIYIDTFLMFQGVGPLAQMHWETHLELLATWKRELR
jgi:hypothetical protein